MVNFIHNLNDQVFSISMEMESLNEFLFAATPETLDKEGALDMISSIVNDIWEYHDRFLQYVAKFKISDKNDGIGYLYACVEELNKMAPHFEDKSINEKKFLEELQDRIDLASIFWKDKYVEDFECWQNGLISKGLHLCGDVSFYDDSKAAFAAMIKNALKAEKLFYSLPRNKKYNVLVPIKNTLVNNRQTAGQTARFETDLLSGRSVLAVSIASVKGCLEGVDQRLLTDGDSIANNLHWHKTKKINWNREVAKRGKEIKYQFKPIPGQLANVFTSGIGKYGREKEQDILAVFESLTGGDGEKEKSLARLLIKYKRGNGDAITEESLRNEGLNLPGNGRQRNVLIDRLHRAAYLICFQEVYRRKNQGRLNGSKVLELPFGMAVSCLLQLLADGHLRMEQAFNANATYGVFTGTGVMSSNLITTIMKFNELFSFFVKKYAGEIYEVWDYGIDLEEVNIVFTEEYFHHVLRKGDGGESESDDEDYAELPIDEAQELEPYIQDLQLTPSQIEF